MLIEPLRTAKMSDNEALITQFMDVTGVTRERAEFYLDSSNYQLQVGIFGLFVCLQDFLINHRHFRLLFRASTKRVQEIFLLRRTMKAQKSSKKFQ